MRVFIPGGAGYVGSGLVPTLLEKGHSVTVYDLYLYGQQLFDDWKQNPRLRQVKGDVRDLASMEQALLGCDAVIHLACISNDPSVELNPRLGKLINLDCFEPFVKIALNQGIKRFIYASSSSVYGVKEEPNVTEEMSLTPLTDYSRFKAECEKILLKYASNDFVCTILRPATVCGYALRQRLDVVVNILANLAYNTGIVKVTGGSQMRPNIHIEDMVRAYIHVLESPKELVQNEIFNVGDHNHTVMELGKMAQEIVGRKRPVDLVVEPTDDVRSYHISSEKISKKLGFTPTHSIEKAIIDLVEAFETGKLRDTLTDMRYFNIKTMKAANLQ